MDQIKIGRFIAECRKQKKLTQMQLAEKLNITDKAISKWERGIAMPDCSIMLEVCDILEISVNELLSGEKIVVEEKIQKNQQLLLDMTREIEQKNKAVWSSMWIILTISLISLLATAFVVKYLIAEGIWQVVAMLGACVLFLIPCFFALKLEISVGVYKCKECGHEIVPTYLEALWAMHNGTTRYLKCPKCKKRTWCKKMLNKV